MPIVADCAFYRIAHDVDESRLRIEIQNPLRNMRVHGQFGVASASLADDRGMTRGGKQIQVAGPRSLQ